MQIGILRIATHHTEGLLPQEGLLHWEKKRYKNDYGKAPVPLTNVELQRIQEGDQFMARKEQMRQRRAAEEDIAAKSHFDRMKQLILMDRTKE